MTSSLPPEPKRLEADRNMPNSIDRMASYLAGYLVAHQYIHTFELRGRGLDGLWDDIIEALYEALLLVDPGELQAIYEAKMRDEQKKWAAIYAEKQAEDRRVFEERKATWGKPKDKAE